MPGLKIMLMAMVVATAIGALGASTASAGIVDVTVEGEVFGIPLDPCDGQLTYSGGPPSAALTLDGSSFVGEGSDPCDEETLIIAEDIEAAFAGAGANWTATLSPFEVIDLESGCTFTRSESTTAASTTGVLGPYNGGGFASGAGGFFCIFGATIELTATF